MSSITYISPKPIAIWVKVRMQSTQSGCSGDFFNAYPATPCLDYWLDLEATLSNANNAKFPQEHQNCTFFLLLGQIATFFVVLDGHVQPFFCL